MYIVNGTATSVKPTISMADFGFSRGITVFELFRVYGGSPFRLEAHLNRLESGAAQLGIALPQTRAQITRSIHTLISTHNYPHSAVKLYLTAGEPGTSSGLSFAACSGFTPQLFIMEDPVKPAHPQAPYGLAAYQTGQRLVTVPHVRELPAVKTANYGIGYVAAGAPGLNADDILFTTPQGLVTEATRANFFCVIGGKLLTPKSGMLHGITRAAVLECAATCGIKAEETDLTAEHLTHATEAFTTGSIAELVPARTLNGTPMQSTMEGPVFSQLRAAFTALIETECGPRQAQSLAAA